MSNAKLIANARLHLNNGNLLAYKRMMESNIRSAMSARSVKQFQDAWQQDMPQIKKLESVFLK